MSNKYSVGTYLKCLNACNYNEEFRVGKVYKVIPYKTDEFYRFVNVKDYGWARGMIEDKRFFIPVDMIITNWKKEMENGIEI